ncbi:hypothetical protein V5O48_007178 [Marasmius crinis-equi]|uniref:F-box domain-containing protein n=1 Tax=Marasmius crinis-equi TaxID=585013 RepID=A0ABR3FHF4_9AGAR
MSQERQKDSRKALHHFKDTPLDILYGIFCLLTPYDLLQLSRTSKDLREILMSKSSLFVWKASWTNDVNMPAPMPTISEPAFAHLLLDPHCHFCLSAESSIAWELMIRCCRKCRYSSSFLSGGEIKGELRNDEVIKFRVKLWKILPQYYESTSGTGKPFPAGLFLAQPTRAIFEEFKALKDDQRDSWLEDKVKETETHSQYTAEYRAWEDRERIRLGYERMQVIRTVTELEESGWSKDLRLKQVREALQVLGLVRQVQPLSDQIWDDIKPSLDEYFRMDIAALLDSFRPSISSARFDALLTKLGHKEQELSRELVFPAVLDIAAWEPFRTIIKDLPAWEGSSSSLFDEALLLLPSLTQDWNDNRSELILNALQVGHHGATTAASALATSLFQCSKQGCIASRSAQPFPSILFHRCSSDIPKELDWPPFPWHTLPYWSPALMQYSSDSLSIELHSMAVTATQTMCQLFDLDSSVATLDTMFKLNPLAECLTCKTEAGSRLFLRWTSVVDHPHHDNLRAASDEEEAIVLVQERGVEEHKPSSTRFRCQHCTFKSVLMNDMKSHLANSHGFPTMGDIDWEFYPFCSMSEVGPSPVWIYPTGLLPPALQVEKDKCARLVPHV